MHEHWLTCVNFLDSLHTKIQLQWRGIVSVVIVNSCLLPVSRYRVEEATVLREPHLGHHLCVCVCGGGVSVSECVCVFEGIQKSIICVGEIVSTVRVTSSNGMLTYIIFLQRSASDGILNLTVRYR